MIDLDICMQAKLKNAHAKIAQPKTVVIISTLKVLQFNNYTKKNEFSNFTVSCTY